ncbi:hypothetical protein ACSAGD_05305 [Paramicrobacterium sp. CJ85]|uniref:hypothetical protein n=1 Tax=Paramicrobacterium sp. CJ85 TaxID=3445355 RepID=UPI003F61BD24
MEETTESTARGRYSDWPELALAIVFAFFYALILWQAVGNLIGMASILGGVLSGFGWFVIVAGVVMPVVCYVGAVVVGRSMSYPKRILVYLVGLTAAAATYVSLVSLV